MPKEIVLVVPENIASDQVVPVIERAAVDLGLTVTLRGNLKSFPGSTHWHLKRGPQRGTLEVTWWPKPRRLWIKIQAGRAAPWIDDIAPQLKRLIELRWDLPTRSV